MTTRRILITTLLLTLAQTLRSQTADDYVSQGRGFLAATNLAAANTSFSNAVALSPGHQVGNLFYAATRLQSWPIRPAGSNFLTRLGIPAAGRDIYNWTAKPPKDANGTPLIPAGLNANEFTFMLRTNLLAEVIGAEANLAKVTDPAFTLSLTSSETRGAAVTLDYGDLQLLRALLQAGEYYVYTAYSWNLDAPLAPVYSLITNHQFSFEGLLRDHPGLLNFATTNDLAASKAALQAGANRYFEASQIIRGRATNVVRLFNYDPDMADKEANFRQTLADLTNSLTHSVILASDSSYTLFLGSQFSGAHPLRSFLPVIRGNGFVLRTLPDPSFGGLIVEAPAGAVEESVETLLAKGLSPIPTIGPGRSSSGPQFQFPINTLKDRGYVVESSTNLHDWAISSAFLSDANISAFADTRVGSSPRRFYRVADRTDDMPPPPNDNFANRIPLTGLGITVSGYNLNATTEPGEPGFPDSVWWSWTAPVSELVTIQSPDREIGHSVEVYTGTNLTSLYEVTTFDEPFDAVAGTTYQLQVGLNPGPIKLVITAPPTVEVSSPQDGDSSPAPASFTISASATDRDGSISGMAFYTDGTLLGSTTSSSLSLTWSNVGPGTHEIIVEASDNLGAITRTYLTVTVDSPSYPETKLTLGVPVANLSGQTGTASYFEVTVPTGVSSLQISTSGGNGDCDLYVAYDYQPDLFNYDYRPFMYGNNETVTISNPSAGHWHIMLNASEAYSGLTLLAN